jgi:hypothetical protein
MNILLYGVAVLIGAAIGTVVTFIVLDRRHERDQTLSTRIKALEQALGRSATGQDRWDDKSLLTHAGLITPSAPVAVGVDIANNTITEQRLISYDDVVGITQPKPLKAPESVDDALQAVSDRVDKEVPVFDDIQPSSPPHARDSFEPVTSPTPIFDAVQREEFSNDEVPFFKELLAAHPELELTHA